jgi:hypothetical protein
MSSAGILVRLELALGAAKVSRQVLLGLCHSLSVAVGHAGVLDPAVAAANCSEPHSYSVAVADTVEAVEVRAVEADVVVVVEVVRTCLAALEDSLYYFRTASVVSAEARGRPTMVSVKEMPLLHFARSVAIPLGVEVQAAELAELVELAHFVAASTEREAPSQTRLLALPGSRISWTSKVTYPSALLLV